jgi:hypothetical protein
MSSVLDRSTAEIASLTAEAQKMADSLKAAPETAAMVRMISERYGRLISTLAAENRKLAAEVASLKARLAEVEQADDHENDADHHWFGNNLRRTWRELRTGR